MSFMQGMRLGAGLVGLGFGIVRLSRGQRDWATRTALTAGLSLTVASMTNRRQQRQIRSLVNTLSLGMPQFRWTVMRRAPQMMANAGSAMMNAFR